MENKVVIAGEVRLKSVIDGEVGLDTVVDGEASKITKVSASDHTKLRNRDAADQHPISAITGLQTALDEKVNTSELAAVAFSGKIEDLTQSQTLIINCGTSTEVE